MTELPEGVLPEDLYDGPDPEKIVPMKRPPLSAGELVQPVSQTPPQAAPQPPAEVSPVLAEKTSYPAVLMAALDVLNARLLGLIAVIAACLIWGYAVFDPTQARTIAASLFSITALLPLIVLYWRAGMTGTGG